MNAVPQIREFEIGLPIGYVDAEGTSHRHAALRKMTGKEEAILADRRFQNNGGKLVTELLYSCLLRINNLPKVDRNVVSGMYSADRNYLLLKLRNITFGAELETSYTCPACNENMQNMENLEELPVLSLGEEEAAEDITVVLEDGYIDKDGQVHSAMSLRLPTGKDEEAVASQMRQNPSLGKNALLARCMKSLGDMPKHRLEAIGPKIMSDLTMTDRRLIDRALNENAPGVNMTREIECINCGHQFKSTLDLTHFFVLE